MLFDPTVTLGNLLAALALLVSLCTTVFAWFASRRSNVEARFQRVDERFKEGSDRMDRQEGRIARAEQSIQSLPGKDDIHQIELSLANLAGTLQRVEAVMEGNQKIMSRLETVVTRHEDHLLNK
ncbi:DUF2730 family protein [Tritonibacter mobilis]|uniref:DUF2730 family protein n=1 Tax=Tritonibacter mobilis F1926 TaxID=1265309 RepID=A0A1B1A050_9RHOB|nr:DUF2730 family protein [Tritonibacter mobilis]ANP39911.1 hypothetical protein K529_003955 [Tritonibacter mobilis F1926]KJZ21839.1 hypothetical protein TW79_20870 [Tritonibacter mobilis]